MCTLLKKRYLSQVRQAGPQMSSAPMVSKLSCTSYSSFLASTRPPRSTKCPCKGFFLERKVGKILSVPLKLGESKSKIKNCFLLSTGCFSFFKSIDCFHITSIQSPNTDKSVTKSRVHCTWNSYLHFLLGVKENGSQSNPLECNSLNIM